MDLLLAAALKIEELEHQREQEVQGPITLKANGKSESHPLPSPRNFSTSIHGSRKIEACLVPGCTCDIALEGSYSRKSKACREHRLIPSVNIGGKLQRFCQQCSRFEEVINFDGLNRSCRMRLHGRSQRRRVKLDTECSSMRPKRVSKYVLPDLTGRQQAVASGSSGTSRSEGATYEVPAPQLLGMHTDGMPVPWSIQMHALAPMVPPAHPMQ